MQTTTILFEKRADWFKSPIKYIKFILKIMIFADKKVLGSKKEEYK